MNLKQKIKNNIVQQRLFCFALFGSICTMEPAFAIDFTPVNETKVNMTRVIADACSKDRSINDKNFQDRCDALIQASGGSFRLSLNSDVSQNGAMNGINQVAPEQSIVSGVQSTRTMKSISSISNAMVTSRLEVIRAQLHNPNPQATRYADRSKLEYEPFSFAFNPAQTGGSAGITDSNWLGVWGNGNYITGDVDTSNNQLGFDFDNWSGTLGVDYRVTDQIITGVAFSYLNTDADVNGSGSQVESDSYTGSLFGMYTHESGFYIDAIASYGAAEFEIERDISYTAGTDEVDAVAKGSPDGTQYSFGAGIGYQYNIGATTIESFARADYQELEIKSFDESESGTGQGWVAHFSKQRIRSLPTSVGLRLSHVFSSTWGVIQPQIHGAWYHEFKDDKRNIQTRFIGNRGNRTYNIVTEGSDRDYYTVGASLIATLAHGITAYTSYSTMLGYRDIDSHRVTFGG